MPIPQPLSERLLPAKSPRLPIAHPEYRMDEQEQLMRALRLYFTQLDNNILSLFSPNGGRFLSAPYGAFSATNIQSVSVIDTPTQIALQNTDYANDTWLSSNRLYVHHSGVYNVQFSAQLTNTDTQAHDAVIWLRKSSSGAAAVDIPYSSSITTVASTHGGNIGYLVVAANFFVGLVAGDYVEFWWASNSLQVQLNTLPPITTPFVNPGSPALVATMSFVSALPT